ncbi:4Fe-4S dicluster domain-containing protein [Paramaledivibacter caminithermalis]|uniref:Reductive dehalogenase n=1 Tax=Paramaledivibacter caminithermalis (strain DSM 15212 / CIP 107654 / DViRD3) TaxID=1121301 RepID=A0A1M6LRG2_PARC5|nr:reductive dehalogenase domain-containing protein [Paramaledivibacter caminithermalis]SHJ73750.1 reductive dehalogenase [Paramaledivibacter caminithermalis DSM 15212]
MKRIDERDTMFARMSYHQGSREYEDYYKRNPNKKEIDDELKALPNICGEGTATFHPLHSPIADAGFRFLSDIKKYVEGEVNDNKVKVEADEITRKIKKLSIYFGAKLTGIARMKDYFYYSHRGRNCETYGEEINQFHRYGIVFAVEMDKDMINRAPQCEEVIAVTKGYIDAAIIGMWISYYIRELGYEARNHMDGNYLVVAPLVAQDAGLGEIGRNGLLITKEYGQRVRLGVVTTDMPLIPDERQDFGIKEFCKVCNKCSKTCPGKAIPSEDMEDIDGVRRWKINQEKCYGMWRRIGTDCGICLSTCPFSQGVAMDLINKMKDSKYTMDKILKEYEERYGIRPYIREPLDLLK